MTDESENKSTGKSKNYVPLAAIILGAPILVIVFLVVMRCAFKPPARISVIRETTTQPVPFDAETREEVRDFVVDEIDQQTGQSHQQFNTIASALIAVASTILLATIGILALGWWRQTREHDKVIKEAEDYRTTTKHSADEAAKDAKLSKEYLKQTSTVAEEAQNILKQIKEDRKQSETAASSADASTHFSQALKYENEGEMDNAIKEYGMSIAAEESPGAYNNRGIMLAKKEELDKAIENYNRAIELDPKFAPIYINRGNAWAKKGELDKAIKNYNKVIELDPKNATAYNNRGKVRADKGDYDNAIADYNNAIVMDPNYVTAYNNRGTAWADKGEFDKALADYDKASELDTGDAICYRNAAEALITLRRDFRGAAEKLNQGRRRDAFKTRRDRLIVCCLEGIALALNGEDASAAEAEAKRLLAGGAKAGEWDTEPMDRFLKDLKPEDFADGALETARRIQEMLKK